jgi:SAM-dependent methyltransferase
MADLSRQYNKLCDLPDFDDPQVRAKLREIVAPGYAADEELRRKFWEYAMLGLYLEEVGALREDADVLSVAAGHEEPLYWLANRAGRVVATDIYGEGSFAVDGREADRSMLEDPGQWAPYPYREDHLEVRSMDALALEFPDAAFDVVFSLSSIEHFGPPESIQRAAAEMSRVLKPGGHLVIVTEYLIKPHPLDWPPLQAAIKVLSGGRRCENATLRQRLTDTFRPRELRRDVIAPTGLEPIQPLDTTLSPSTFENVITWIGDAPMRPATGRDYPHILLKGHGSPWTSAFVGFHKPGSAR